MDVFAGFFSLFGITDTAIRFLKPNMVYPLIHTFKGPFEVSKIQCGLSLTLGISQQIQ